MSAHLHVVDTTTGEIRGGCESCEALKVQLAGAERENRAWRARCAQLERDREGEARASELWEPASLLFAIWRRECGHPRSKWTADRFWQIEPLLGKYGQEMCERAIAGAAFDCYTVKRRNGSEKRFDEWSLIFRDAGHLEEFCNRCPTGWSNKRGGSE